MRRINDWVRLGLGGCLLLATACDGTVIFESSVDDEATSSGAESSGGSTGASGESSAGEPATGSTGGSSDGNTESGEPICGDGILEGNEACDGDDLGGRTCASLGLGEGQLGCRDDCVAFDPTNCGVEDDCGNGMLDEGEICDGTDLAGETCVSQGFDAGDLGCNADCTALVDSECIDWVGDCCAANGSIGCDDSACTQAICDSDPYCCNNMWDFQCASLAQTNAEAQGVCAGTGGSCHGLCGDGIVETGEVCDGAALAGATCESAGFEGGGGLACDASCEALDTAGCVAGAGGCCENNGTPGCEHEACSAIICAMDDFCCSNNWDGV